jgi:hypothetical protein
VGRRPTEVELVLGSLVYRIHESGFEILRLSAVPGDERTRSAFVDFFVGLCCKPTRRKRITYYIADGDWENLRFFVSLGWERRLLRNHFNGDDALLVSLATATPATNTP